MNPLTFVVVVAFAVVFLSVIPGGDLLFARVAIRAEEAVDAD